MVKLFLKCRDLYCISGDDFQGEKIKFYLLCSRMVFYDKRRLLQTSLSIVLKIRPFLLLNNTFINDPSMAAANILSPTYLIFPFSFFLILAANNVYKNWRDFPGGAVG